MPYTTPDPARLVADVGGTNTRIGLFDPRTDALAHVTEYRNRDFDNFEALVGRWLDALPVTRPRQGCIAVAAPPAPDLVRMSNLNWSFSCSDLAARFGFERLGWINDFVANAHALPHLGDSDRAVLHPGNPTQPHRLAVVGPGTGLGGAVLDRSGERPLSYPCEPGHMGLSPGSAIELEVFSALLKRYPDIYAELLVSGPGLARLHGVLCELEGGPATAMAPEDISRQGQSKSDPACARTLQVFCELLGSVCGDFLLANGAYGGLYLAGGIVPGLIEFLPTTGFQERLVSKGAMRGFLEAVPVQVITARHPGLIGAAHAPL